MIPARLAELAHRVPTDLGPVIGGRLPSAAVLLLVWEESDGLQLLLTRRAVGLRTQPGDIALPGGRCDPGESPTQTALREAAEEVGLDPAEVQVVGRFDEAWSSSRTLVTPIVGWRGGGRPTLVAAEDEVAEILVVSLQDLADPANHSTRVTPAGAYEYRDDVLTVGDMVAYGFTADLVLDLTEWMAGRDRRMTERRLADLAHFAPSRDWW
ncbi:MAG: NUDIX hydrolase [Acidimicrobiales bacterium]